MSNLILKTISEVKTEKVRTDSKESRSYYTAEFKDPANPFAPTVKRVIWQSHDGEGKVAWRSGNPSEIKGFLNKLVPAQIVSRQIKPETVMIDNVQRTVNKFTTVVFAHETVESVFKAAGKEILVESTTTSDVPTVNANAERVAVEA